MSAIQEISPYLEHFQEKIREEKEAQRLTIDQLAEKSGVPYSVVSRVSSGAHPDPKLINAAALCSALGLSLDILCGLATPQTTDEELAAKYHALELENAELRGVDRTRLESMASQRSIIIGAFASFAFSILTTLALAAYLIGDAMHISIGLIKYGELSAPAVALILLIVVASGNAILLAYRLYKHKKG